MSQKEKEVWQACEDLLAQGKSPKEITGEAIGNRLRELGFKAGSLTYRYRYRDSWMARRGLSREANDAFEFKTPDIIERSAVIFKKSLEESLRLEFEAKQQNQSLAFQELTNRFELQQKELEEINRVKEKMSAELTQIKHQNRELRQSLQIKHEDFIQIQEKAHYTRKLFEEKLSDSEKLKIELKNNQKENLEVLQKMIVDLKSQYLKEIEVLHLKHEQEQKNWISERDDLKYQVSKLENALDKALLFERQASEEILALKAILENRERDLKEKENRHQELEELFFNERTKLSRLDERLKIALAEIKHFELTHRQSTLT